MLAGGAAFVRSCVVVAFMLFLAALLFPVIRSNRVARFWACGMILSLVPVCAMLASSRLLIFVGIGGAGLLAQFVTFVCEEKKNSSPAVRSARIRQAACWAFGGCIRSNAPDPGRSRAQAEHRTPGQAQSSPDNDRRTHANNRRHGFRHARADLLLLSICSIYVTQKKAYFSV